MRVTIDHRLCVGSGACVDAAPGVFALVPAHGGLRAVLVAPADRDDLLAAAAHACPTLAITLQDEDGTVRYPVGRG